MGSKADLDILTSELFDAIAEFDGKSPSILSEAEVRFSDHQHYLDALISLSASDTDSASSGATWLLKSACEKGEQLSSDQADKLIDKAHRISDWSAQLHICQTLYAIPITVESLPILLNWLRPLIKHKRPFLRAWAISAFCDLATAHSELIDEAKTYLAKAKNDPAASVRARMRKITLGLSRVQI